MNAHQGEARVRPGLTFFFVRLVRWYEWRTGAIF